MRGLQKRRPVTALSGEEPARPSFYRHRWVIVGAVAAVVVALDQLTKTLAVRELTNGPVHVIWTLQLNLSYNNGVAFSMARGLAPIIVPIGIILVALMLGLGRSVATVAALVGLGLVVGGAAGNLADRLFRGQGGSVVDFIDFQWWPIFNVADSAISCGSILLIVSSLRGDARPSPAGSAAGR